MQCPKCHRETLSEIECSFCGIIYDKYRKHVEQPANTGEQSSAGEWEIKVALEDGKYPTPTRRYIATAIDLSFVLLAIIAISYLFEDAGETAVKVRAGLILFLVLHL